MSALVAKAVDLYGPQGALVASFTRTAARELAGRDLAGVKAATLHSHCWHALDQPKIANTFISSVPDKYAEEGIMPWNEAFPAYALSGEKADIDDAYGEPGDGEGEYLHGEYQRLRSMLIPREFWPDQRVAWFGQHWDDWKAQHGLLDFNDLIEVAVEERPYAPGAPVVGFFDEAQDFTPLQLKLIRTWAQYMNHVVLVGDDDQVLYEWAGCTPQAFLEPPVPEEQVRVLSQSWRVPRKVHERALRWVEQITYRQPKLYLPRDADGHVYRSGATWQAPDHLIARALDHIEQGQSVMFLATCGYMLLPLIKLLRGEGIPFHNPYRRCSPPDELVLTTEGYVPISQLDPAKHRLAGYYAKGNALSWGGRSGPHQNGDARGFGFIIGSQPYAGDMLTIKTERSTTRVTPNHRLRVRYSEAFDDQWVVYLMRRGGCWRIGSCMSGGARKRCGVSDRLAFEGGDAAWVLGIYGTRTAAMLAEASLQARYGLPALTFVSHPSARRVMSQSDLDAFHGSLAEHTSRQARQLLEDHRLLVDYPFFERDGRRHYRIGRSFEVVAANLLPGYMELPVPPPAFVAAPSTARCAPDWLPFTLERSPYEGEVWSMDVPGVWHYISGGAVVHNSHGAWNPLSSAGTSMSERLMAFLRFNPDIWGEDARMWTHKELANWIEPLRADGILRRGAKTAIKEAKSRPELVTWEEMAAWFEESALNDLYECQPGWYARNVLDRHAKTLQFPLRVLDRQGPVGLKQRPSVIVGTVHCSPPDEPILTTVGWVPIGELDPARHRIAAYRRTTNDLAWGGRQGDGRTRTPYGFPFEISVRPYSGRLVTMTTASSRTRVTPNHRVLAKFNEEFFDKWVVYLMRRGDWWRVGVATSASRPYKSGGVGGRLGTERADDGWILSVHETRESALMAEAFIQARYGVPGLTFEADHHQSRLLSSAQLHHVHGAASTFVTPRAHALLADFGLDADWPLYTRAIRNGDTRKRNMANIFVTEAANLVPLNGYVDVPVASQAFANDPQYNRSTHKPILLPAEIGEEEYSGEVYGLDVPPYHHYISGGAVVHNSVKGGEADAVMLFPDLSTRGYEQWRGTRQQQDSVRRVFYVGMTRARDSLYLCSPSKFYAVEGL